MPAPTSYSETSLKQLMVDELSSTGAALGLTTASPSIVNGVWAVERLLGDAVADVTDLAVLEAAARWQAWLAAEAASANDKEIKSATTGLKLSERFDHIQVRLTRAEAAYYAAKSASEAASGAGTGFFFGLAHGCRGR